MGIYCPDLRDVRARQSHQAVFYLYDLFSHDIVFKLHQKIVYLIHDTRRGIFDGQHGKVRASFLNGCHGIPKGIHMKALHLLPEIPEHRHLGIGALRPLKNHSGLLCLQLVHRNKGKSAKGSRLRQLIILELPAHGHDLLKKLLHPVGIKRIVREGAHFFQFLRLPALIKHLLACLYLIIRHLGRNRHTFFIKGYDLLVNRIQLYPQIC